MMFIKSEILNPVDHMPFRGTRYEAEGFNSREYGPVLQDSLPATAVRERNETDTLRMLRDIVEHTEQTAEHPHSEGACSTWPCNGVSYVPHHTYIEAVVKRFGSLSRDLYVSAKYGIYDDPDDPIGSRVGSFGGQSHAYMGIGNIKLFMHWLTLFCLVPDAFDLYCKNSDLVVNHVRIPSPGESYYEFDPRYLELVSSSRNRWHSLFVYRWSMFGVPISASMVEELETYLAARVSLEGVKVVKGNKKVKFPKIALNDDQLHQQIVNICTERFKTVIRPDPWTAGYRGRFTGDHEATDTDGYDFFVRNHFTYDMLDRF